MLMNRLLFTAAILGLAIPAAASAQAAAVTGTVTVTGAVAARCQFTTGNASIDIPELSDTSTSALDPATVSGAPHATLVGWCNGTASTIQVEAQPLLNTATAPTGFTNRVDYTATATANSVSVTDNSLVANSDNTAASVGIFTGNIDVGLSQATSPTGKLIAGAYLGHVIVTLTPSA
jgi:hypothetical protein